MVARLREHTETRCKKCRDSQHQPNTTVAAIFPSGGRPLRREEDPKSQSQDIGKEGPPILPDSTQFNFFIHDDSKNTQ